MSETAPESYVLSKLNGVHQLCDVITHRIPRPIETPVRNMRPARIPANNVTGPKNLSAISTALFYHYLSDDTNTPFAVVGYR